MKITLKLLLAFLFAVASTTASEAQYRQNRALQVGIKVGASSYTGDVGPAPPGTPAFDATYEFEAFYRFNRWLNVGVKHSTGAYPALGFTDRRHSTAIGLRSYFFGGRFSPYVQVGASRSYGGEKAGLGVSSAVGAEIAISQRFALYQEVSFDSVFPDEALDGAVGGRSYDLFGRIGVGVRFSFGRAPGVLRIQRVEYPGVVEAGKPVEMRAVVQNGGNGLNVEWELPGGVLYQSNPVEHTFADPGEYEFDVVAISESGRVQKRVRLLVAPSAEELAAAAARDTIGIARIQTIYGPRVTVAGTESTYRVRLAASAELPVEYSWSMGDGGTLEGNNVSYSYDAPGTYSIRAVVRNAVGADTLSFAVLVDPAKAEETTLGNAVESVESLVVQSDPVKPDPVQPDPTQVDPAQPEPAESESALPVAETEVEDEPAAPLDAASVIAKKIAAADDGADQESAGQQDLVLQAPPVPGIDWQLGGYTWVVETLESRDAADKRVPEYKSLGFPVGVFRDAYNGKVEYHVVVGQSASQTVAERIGVRIQRHVPRRIWLLEIPQ